jgi:hypothetical protein
MSKKMLALIEILEFAKAHRDLADGPEPFKHWSRVAGLAFNALGKPSLARLEAMKENAKKGFVST